jgi:hypothetical protein
MDDDCQNFLRGNKQHPFYFWHVMDTCDLLLNTLTVLPNEFTASSDRVSLTQERAGDTPTMITNNKQACKEQQADDNNFKHHASESFGHLALAEGHLALGSALGKIMEVYVYCLILSRLVILFLILFSIYQYSQILLISLMSERRQAVEDAEVGFYNMQIEEVKVTLATAKQMEAAAGCSAARIEMAATNHIEGAAAALGNNASDARRNKHRSTTTPGSPTHTTTRSHATTPTHATTRSRDTTPASSSHIRSCDTTPAYTSHNDTPPSSNSSSNTN